MLQTPSRLARNCLLVTRTLTRRAGRPAATSLTVRAFAAASAAVGRGEATFSTGARGSVQARAAESGVETALDDAAESSGSGQLLDFFATCSPGLESVVAAELSSKFISARDVQEGSAGVSFRGSRSTGYRANLWLRSAIRVLVRLAAADLHIDPYTQGRRGGDAVYDFVKAAAPWAEVIPLRRNFSIDTRIRDCTDIRSDLMAGTMAKNAICDALRDARGEKPDPPEDTADVPLFLTLYRDKAILYRDMSGASLHKRGYREGIPIHKGALNESMAAGILSLAVRSDAERCALVGTALQGATQRVTQRGWAGAPERLLTLAPLSRGREGGTLVDPMCGSGTFLIEGALMAGSIAPGLLRSKWPFQSWPDHSAKLWGRCVEEAREVARDARAGGALSSLTFCGGDLHGGALGLAEQAATAAGVRKEIRFQHSDVRSYAPEGVARVTHLVTNPPWGLRLQGPDDVPHAELLETWFQLGCFLRGKCGGAEAFMLTGNPDPAAKLFLKGGRRVPLTVGGIDCRLLHFSILDSQQRSESVTWRDKALAGSSGGARGKGRGRQQPAASAPRAEWAAAAAPPRLAAAAAPRADEGAAGGAGARGESAAGGSGGGGGMWADMADESSSSGADLHPLQQRRAAGAAAGAADSSDSSAFASERDGGGGSAAPADGAAEERAPPPAKRRQPAVTSGASTRPKGGRWGGLRP